MADTHAFFIAAAYGASAVSIALLGLWILFDGRAVRRQLAAMEARGIRRRSSPGTGDGR
ncbi:heme exporter protein CcmD [Ancylobacter sp. Lp-2]|uniref:heme exporter protein CcmD n=1 Tax=Ancylobacter sp. Lp-2 TaxID=2881339 RepID=UPI001E32D0B0|nr:heme exporter protein CcmD [Ancylobacter sp. Lp-2]MCB4770778.1 heme exporter protein CcmD [Ancylobacter sp. Lp-2]